MIASMFTVRRLVTVAGLVFAWLALWGTISVANILSGILVSVLVLGSGVGTSGRGGIRIGPLLRFGLLVLIDLVKSSFTVAWEILTPTDYTEEAIIAVEAPVDTRHHLLLLVVAVTVTPGTAVIDTDPDTGTLYVHLLHANKADEIRAHVLELSDLACRALPMSAEVKDHAIADRGAKS
ncbi:MAG: Na+/H+ antiporter subunit E [Acidimicrobiales bacterium]